MATKIRKGQLDVISEYAINSVSSSHDDCLITEPTLSVTTRQESGVGIVNVAWTTFDSRVNGEIFVIPTGNIDLNSTDIPPTTFYLYVNASGVVLYSADELPSPPYALIGKIRFKSSGGDIVVYYASGSNNAINKAFNKLQNKNLFEYPRLVGGSNPQVDANGYISLTQPGIGIVGNEVIDIPTITNGSILLDNETDVIANLGQISTYLDDTTIPTGEVFGVLVGYNTGNSDIPFMAVRAKGGYATIQDCIEDRSGTIQKGFGEYYGFEVIPLFIFIHRKGNLSDRAIIDMRGRTPIPTVASSETIPFRKDIGISETLVLRGTSQPSLSQNGESKIYFDSASGKLKASENGNDYVDIIPSSGGSRNLLDRLSKREFFDDFECQDSLFTYYYYNIGDGQLQNSPTIDGSCVYFPLSYSYGGTLLYTNFYRYGTRSYPLIKINNTEMIACFKSLVTGTAGYNLPIFGLYNSETSHLLISVNNPSPPDQPVFVVIQNGNEVAQSTLSFTDDVFYVIHFLTNNNTITVKGGQYDTNTGSFDISTIIDGATISNSTDYFFPVFGVYNNDTNNPARYIYDCWGYKTYYRNEVR